MLDTIEPRQFTEWMAYHRLEPFGDEWEQAATISMATNNAAVLAWTGELHDVAYYMPDPFKTSEEQALEREARQKCEQQIAAEEQAAKG